MIEWLSGWYNWPFLFPLALGLIYIFLDTAFGGLSELLGQQRFLGVDISPGAKTYLEFSYERPEERVPVDYNDPYWFGTRTDAYPEGIPGPFYLAEISKGARPPVDVRPLTFPNQAPGLVKPVIVDFEFPFKAQINWRHGYSIPFMDNEGETSAFRVPSSLRRG